VGVGEDGNVPTDEGVGVEALEGGRGEGDAEARLLHHLLILCLIDDSLLLNEYMFEYVKKEGKDKERRRKKRRTKKGGESWACRGKKRSEIIGKKSTKRSK
jgi:hypothetical protein